MFGRLRNAYCKPGKMIPCSSRPVMPPARRIFYRGYSALRRLAGLLPAVLLAAALAMLLFVFAPQAQAASGGLNDLQSAAVNWLQNDYQKNGVQDGVGSFSLYLLNKAGVDTGSWTHNGVDLKEAVLAQIAQDVGQPDETSANALAQDLLAAQAAGQSDLAAQVLAALQKRQQASGFDDNEYDNYETYDLLSRSGNLDLFNTDWAKNYLLSQTQKGADGHYTGWGLFDWKGTTAPDIMSTNEAVRILAALDTTKSDPKVQAVISDSLSLLQKQQQSDGSFVGGMDDPLIDTVEILKTLNALGLQPDAWQSGAKSAVDYLLAQAVNADGSLGSCQNAMDADWALDASLMLQTPPASPTGQNPNAQPLQGNTTQNNQDNTSQATTQASGASAFSDINGYWAEQDILLMASKGYVSGVGDGLFAPDAAVTRAQFAALLVKALGIAGQGGQTLLFSDVPDGYWGAAAIDAAAQQGLVSGVGNGRFQPDSSITREELAVMVVRALQWKGAGADLTPEQTDQALSGYTDAGQLDGWAREAVAVCINRGLISGRSAASLSGQSDTSRAEAVVVLEKLLQSLGEL